MLKREKFLEEIQIVGMFFLIIGLSTMSLMNISYKHPVLMVIWIFGGLLTMFGYTLNWLKLGPSSFVFWQNLISYILFALFVVSMWLGLREIRQWLIYTIAVFSSIAAGYQLARQFQKLQEKRKSSMLNLSNIILLCAVVFFISGAISIGRNEISEELIIAGIVLFLAWGISLKRKSNSSDVRKTQH